MRKRKQQVFVCRSCASPIASFHVRRSFPSSSSHSNRLTRWFVYTWLACFFAVYTHTGEGEINQLFGNGAHTCIFNYSGMSRGLDRTGWLISRLAAMIHDDIGNRLRNHENLNRIQLHRIRWFLRFLLSPFSFSLVCLYTATHLNGNIERVKKRWTHAIQKLYKRFSLFSIRLITSLAFVASSTEICAYRCNIRHRRRLKSVMLSCLLRLKAFRL